MTRPARNPVALFASDISRLIRREMKAWDVPGTAVGVVSADQVVYAGAHGLRDLQRTRHVTDRTLFPIGSATKSFTATAAAILVDEGLLAWDRPIREYLPDFRLADSVATRHATLRDLLSHQVGLAPHNELNPFDTRRRRLARLRYLPFAQPFRSGYLYNNKMYLAAGSLIEHVTGTPYERFVRDRILRPSGLTSTCFASDLRWCPPRAPAELDLVVGYLPGPPRKPFFHGWAKDLTVADIYHSNGADQTMHSNLSDMCRWLQMQVNGGCLGDCRILSPRRLNDLRSPQVSAAGVPWLTGGDLASTHYAMGWVTQTWRGCRRIFHGGTGCGCMSRVSFLPDERIGVVVLCNTYAGAFIEAITLGLFDRLLGLGPIRWTTRLKQETRRRQRKDPRTPPGLPPRPQARPSRPLGEYAGSYHHPGYGRILIVHDGRRLQMHYGPVIFRMRHDHDDVFRMHEHFTGTPVRLAAFALNRRGRIAAVSIPFEPSVPPIVFRRE